MSYSVQIGRKAHEDLILAKASNDAAQAILASMQEPSARRATFIRQATRRYGSDSPRKFDHYYAQVGGSDTQRRFDAFRLVAANHYAKIGMQAVQAAVAQAVDADRAGLGDEAKAIGCGITGGTTALLAVIAGAYSAGAAAAPVAGVGNLVAGAMDCGAGAREAAQQTAAMEAQAAQLALQAASAQEAAESAAADRERLAQRKTFLTAAAIGGGVLLLFGVGYAIIKV